MQGRLYLLSDIALVTDIGISNLGFNHTIQCKQLNICLHVFEHRLCLCIMTKMKTFTYLFQVMQLMMFELMSLMMIKCC